MQLKDDPEQDTLAQQMELITPAGFEGYFAEMAALLDAAGGGLPDPERAAALFAKYGLSMDFGSVPGLMQAYGLEL